jgi:hypothetical protein
MTRSSAADPQAAGFRVSVGAAGVTGGVALVTNAVWELTQRPLYEVDPSVLRCLSAAVVDAAYTVAAVVGGALVAQRNPRAFLPVVVAALAVAAAGIESWARDTDRWSYADAMPTVAGLGLSPLVQLPLLGALSAWAGRRVYYNSQHGMNFTGRKEPR